MSEIVKNLRRRWKLVIGLLVALFLFSVSVGIAGAYVLASTSTEEFCTSCHEMSYNLAEYKGTIHDTNRTGVRAICTNCHVPHEPGPLVLAKIKVDGEEEQHVKAKGDEADTKNLVKYILTR